MQLNIARQTKYYFDGAGFSGERLVNWYFRPGEGLAPGKLVCTSGLRNVVSLTSGKPVRGMVYNGQDDLIYAVSNGRLWTLDSAGTSALVAGSGGSSGPIPDGITRMATNGAQIGMVVDGRYFVYDTAKATLRERNTGNLLTVNDIDFLDGYFVLTGTTAARRDSFTISGLYDGETINALDVATAEVAPDAIRGVLVDHSELWLFGAKTIELWYNSGAADFPFARTAGGVIEHGAKAYSWAKEDNRVFWTDDDGVVYAASGIQPQVISTREIETRIRAGVFDQAFVLMDKNHKFYVVRMSDGPALCYDMTTGLWSERATGADLGFWRGCCAARAFSAGEWYVGAPNGNILKLDPDYFLDGGATIVRVAQNPPVDRQNEWFAVNNVTLRGLTGAVDIGRDIVATLQTSRDGYEWREGRSRSGGRLGQYGREMKWNGLGSFQQFHTRLTFTDPAPFDVWGVTVG